MQIKLAFKYLTEIRPVKLHSANTLATTNEPTAYLSSNLSHCDANKINNIILGH